MSLLRLSYAATTAVVFAACHSPVEPVGPTGRYHLVRLGAQALPAPLVVNGVQIAAGGLTVDSLIITEGILTLTPRAYVGRLRSHWVRAGIPVPATVEEGIGTVRLPAAGLVELVTPNGCSTRYAVRDGGRELRTRPGGVLCGIALYREDVYRRVD